jgi:hypothetical protein
VLLRVRNFYAQSEVQARLRELADRRPTLRLPDRGMVQTPLHGVALGGVDTALADVLLNNVIAALANFRQISVTQLASATGKATWSGLEMSAKALGTLGQQSALTLKAAGEYAVSGTSAMVVDSAEYVKRVRRPFSQSFSHSRPSHSHVNSRVLFSPHFSPWSPRRRAGTGRPCPTGTRWAPCRCAASLAAGSTTWTASRTACVSTTTTRSSATPR